MDLKQLRSTLCLFSISALIVDGAIAEPGHKPTAWDWKTKFASDYNAGNFRAAITDSVALEKLGALDPPSAIVTAQAYYKVADYAGCTKYIREHFYVPKPDNIPAGDKPAIAQLLERCQKL